WMRPPGESHAGARLDSIVKGTAPAPAPPLNDAQGTSLRNPLSTAEPVAENPGAAPAASAPAVPSTTSPATAPPAVVPSAGMAAPPAAAGAANANPAAALPRTPAAEQPLALAFRDYSWTEVRDRDGRVLLSGMYKG